MTLLLTVARIASIIAVCVLLQLLPSAIAYSQWHLLHTFSLPDPTACVTGCNGIAISAIYFLDLPGLPRVGYVGITSVSASDTNPNEGGEVWRTSDGGETWNQVGPAHDRGFFERGVRGFTFKDSLTGWLITIGSAGGCFETRDGGLTWTKLPTPGPSEGSGIFYVPSSGLLLVGRDRGNLAIRSTDYGTTWSVLNFYSGGFSGNSSGYLLSPGSGQMSSGFTPDEFSTDGGNSWQARPSSLSSWQPIVSSDGQTLYSLGDTEGFFVSHGALGNWRLLHQFKDHSRDANPVFTCRLLLGSDSCLFAQTPDGVFSSTDSGVTWRSECGPPNDGGGLSPKKGMFSKGANIYLSELNFPNQPARLWVRYGATEPPPQLVLVPNAGSGVLQRSAGGSVQLQVRTASTLFPTASTDSAAITLTFDSDLFSYHGAVTVAGWSVRTLADSAGYVTLRLVRSPSVQFLPDSTIATLTFQTNIARETSGTIRIVKIDWDEDASWFDCAAQSLTAMDSVVVQITPSCGDSLLRGMLGGSLAFDLLSVSPNPATSGLTVSVANRTGGAYGYQLVDDLGRSVLAGTSASDQLRLDVTEVAAGSYYLRLQPAGTAPVTRRIVIER